MSIYRLDTDLVVQSGDAQWRVQRVLDDQYVQLENQTTGQRQQAIAIRRIARRAPNGRVHRNTSLATQGEV